jgi:hypothetical protein
MKLFFLYCLLVILLFPIVNLSQSEKCLMKPTYLGMEIPTKGFIWLENEEFQGVCDEIPDTGWIRYPGKEFNMYIHTDGPEGSGRFWNVSVGFSAKSVTKPERGFCFITSTIGWRTLRKFDQTLLKWVNDEDADGKPELVIWDSFPLSEESQSMAEFGLMAWVYQVDLNGKCKIDWHKSRKKAFEIETAYRRPIENNDSLLIKIRKTAADALENFASEKCGPSD